MQLLLDLDSTSERVISKALSVPKLIPYQIYAFDQDKGEWVASYTEARSKEEMIKKAEQWCPHRIAHCGSLIRLTDNQKIEYYPHKPEGIPIC